MEERKPEDIKITDRRHFHADGTPRADVTGGEEDRTPPPASSPGTGQPEPGSKPASQAEPPGAPTFLGFLAGLVGGAASHLGLAPQLASGQTVVDLRAAKEMIDILTLLEEKTKGNLTPQEEQFLQNSLTELRLTYVRVASQHK